MKINSIVLSFIIVLILGSCDVNPKNLGKNTIIIGNVESDEIESVLFYYDTLFTVVPVENRRFEVELPNQSENYFLGIAAKFSRGYFFAINGDTIRMNIDLEKFNESIYSNFNDPVNKYLFEKQKKLSAFPIMNIDSSQITDKIDSLTNLLNRDYQNLLKTTSQLTVTNRQTEKVNMSAELQNIDLTSKNITGRKRPLSNKIEFNNGFMKSPQYLDFLDAARWSLANKKIEEEGRNMKTMNIDELIAYQFHEILKIKQGHVRSYLLYRGLRTQIAMKGLEGIETNLNVFEANNSIDRYGILIHDMIKERGAIKRGTPASIFNYEDNMGKEVNLSDFKGRFVFIDVWATWCKPCIAEIPHLKEIEKSFSDKNIEFIAISIDENKDKWKKFLEKNNMQGIQLIADRAEHSSIMKDYKIINLPNYLLIDDEGNIITISAPKPSSGELSKLLEKEI